MQLSVCVFVRSASAGDAVFYGLATSTPQACDICVYKFLATFLSQLRLFCKPLVGESRLLSDATMSLHHTHTVSLESSRDLSQSQCDYLICILTHLAAVSLLTHLGFVSAPESGSVLKRFICVLVFDFSGAFGMSYQCVTVI